jgi:hypothetical protein
MAPPLPVLAATTVGTTAYLAIGYPYGPVLVPMAIAVYTVAGTFPGAPRSPPPCSPWASCCCTCSSTAPPCPEHSL